MGSNVGHRVEEASNDSREEGVWGRREWASGRLGSAEGRGR